VLIEAEFLALVLILVYVGAVMVLFLFVVMMLDINIEALRGGLRRYSFAGWITALVLIVELVGVVAGKRLGMDGERAAVALPAHYSNTRELGLLLYARYVYPFELASILLLVAIIAAIALTMRKRPGHKVQDIGRQVATRASERVRLVKMDSERRP
jgi:NADH-quinone oxidoreductase subunit J